MDPTERKLMILLARIAYRHGTPAEQRKIDDLLERAGQEASEWLPIGTAPKTSRARLVWCPDRENTYVVCWESYREAPQHWSHFGTGGELKEWPSHWMPLPKPPGARWDSQP